MFNPTAMTRIRKEFRTANGQSLSISKLAVMVGSDRALVSSWENGRRETTMDSVIRMADVFDCSVDDLVFRRQARIDETARRAVLDAALRSAEAARQAAEADQLAAEAEAGTQWVADELPLLPQDS